MNASIIFLNNLKQRFKKTISCNKYRSEITKQQKTAIWIIWLIQHLKILIRLFVLILQAGENDPTRNYFNESYMPLIDIKDCNALIDNKPSFDQPLKNKQDAYEKRIEMSRNDDYTTRNLLYYSDHQNDYKLIDIYFPRQTNASIP